MECTYVHVQSDMININVRKNMHFFMTVISNLCINIKKLEISLIIYLMHLFMFWKIKTEREEAQFKTCPETFLWWKVHCGIFLQNNSMLIKKM